ncbi:hypothetical protein HanXRQr2_Chr10g0466281 [Helianthus annuus]|uniref:Uncharacterized protein n=1 Tax=Helianthus annuus TaxID=4232 RepID=A0A9K3N6J9_HELAN|nr:hypothetical protein HanXRQr2_Chr10g0466281 [Helianthus annuus]
MSNAWYYQSMQEFEVVCKPQFQSFKRMIDFGIRVWGLKMNWG